MSLSFERRRAQPAVRARRQRQPWHQRTFRLALVALAMAFFGVIALRLYTIGRYSDAIYGVEDAPSRQVAIVFGAGVWPDGEPTPVLYDRVATAAELYRRGMVQRLL